MAPGLEEELSCPVCRDIFREPVFLSCSHSFCRSCLRRWWKKKEARECPVCKCVSGSKEPPCNLALKNTCEAFLLERGRTAEDLCGLHAEKLKLFCLDHGEPVCLVCRDSKAHRDHRFRPVDEAAQELREELRGSLTPLRDRLKLFQQVLGDLDQTAEHVQEQVRRTERGIRKQFEKLHRFLQEEEEARVAALREEEEEKRWPLGEKIESLRNKTAWISDVIRATEEQLRAEDAELLQRRGAAVERLQQGLRLDRPQLGPGALIDEAKHLGNLRFNIWSRMKETASYTPVILDPNTAEAGLVLSEDLTSFRRGDRREVPENPERFDWRGLVLASRGFRSGSHSWTVEVGDSRTWFVGVAAESFQRKGSIDLRSGLWAVHFSKGKYVILSPRERVSLRPDRKLRVLRARLDLQSGRLSFCDAQTQTQIHEFPQTSTEKLFPIFYTGGRVPLRLLPEGVQDSGGLVPLRLLPEGVQDSGGLVPLRLLPEGVQDSGRAVVEEDQSDSGDEDEDDDEDDDDDDDDERDQTAALIA